MVQQQTEKAKVDYEFRRVFTTPGVHPYDEIQWESRDAVITDPSGKIVFEQKAVEVPTNWSQTATKIAVSKYFRGKMNTPKRETSVKQMVSRVADTISDWGIKANYFQSSEQADTYRSELTHILVNQYAAFNSPVWFNVGVDEHPQCSACFINSIKDDMRAILNMAVVEGMLFKHGSGSGINMSALRSSKELLSSGGKASGPVSFMKGLDAFAGVIKSGGKTRRAAKMVILNVDHPDIIEFIECKSKEERKAHTLIAAGYDASIDGEAYGSIFFQNANNSVRVTDEFMTAVVEDKEWKTKAVTNGQPVETFKARDVMKQMAQAAWECGDPGIQYDTTINRWHTSSNSGRINSSNPCSEYMYLDDTACNLSSLNLMKFLKADGTFDIDLYKHVAEVMITAMEITVGFSSYPTPQITQNSHDFRPLGIGYANLGALLMAMGLAYDSDKGRNFAGALTAILSATAYRQSALIAKRQGTFKFYEVNKEPFIKVMNMHRAASYAIAPDGVPTELLAAAHQSWDECVDAGTQHGYRNGQISVLAPTGTIGFLMDCDTTGVEPDIALVKYKWLVGGGMIKIVNKTIPLALRKLGYTQTQNDDILAYINEHDTIEGAPHLKDEHLSVFDCAFKPANGKRSIHYMGHLRMMGAAQPFISGAISKTVNMPEDATVKDIEEVYIQGWKLGVKAIAIYRDGSKKTQALTTSRKDTQKQEQVQVEQPAPQEPQIIYKPLRLRLADERAAVTHKFSIAGHEGYLTVGLYENGMPGEIFITMAKEGTVISGIMDAFATSTSLALQYGVPLKVLAKKYIGMRFEPNGVTSNSEIRFAKSIVDYIFKWLAYKFMPQEDLAEIGLANVTDKPVAPYVQLPTPKPAQQTPVQKTLEHNTDKVAAFQAQSDAPACPECGSITVRSAACYKCFNCGATTGCS